MTQNLKIFLFQIIIFIWQVKDCFYLYSPWNLIVPIKKPSFTFPPQEISHWIMNYIRSNYTPIIISTGVYNNSRCCSFFLFFFISIFEKELWIFRDNVRENRKTKIARKAFLLSFVRSYQANRTKELFFLSRLFKRGRYQRDSPTLCALLSNHQCFYLLKRISLAKFVVSERDYYSAWGYQMEPIKE